jgi:hypothetical protein
MNQADYIEIPYETQEDQYRLCIINIVFTIIHVCSILYAGYCLVQNRLARRNSTINVLIIVSNASSIAIGLLHIVNRERIGHHVAKTLALVVWCITSWAVLHIFCHSWFNLGLTLVRINADRFPTLYKRGIQLAKHSNYILFSSYVLTFIVPSCLIVLLCVNGVNSVDAVDAVNSVDMVNTIVMVIIMVQGIQGGLVGAFVVFLGLTLLNFLNNASSVLGGKTAEMLVAPIRRIRFMTTVMCMATLPTPFIHIILAMNSWSRNSIGYWYLVPLLIGCFVMMAILRTLATPSSNKIAPTATPIRFVHHAASPTLPPVLTIKITLA